MRRVPPTARHPAGAAYVAASLRLPEGWHFGTALPTANQDCQDELGQVGDAAFIEEYSDDPSDSVDNAMDECVAEDVDSLLNPDQGDDGTDDGTDA